MSTTHPQPLPLIRAAWSQESQGLVATAGLSFSQKSAALKEHVDALNFGLLYTYIYMDLLFLSQSLDRFRVKVLKMFSSTSLVDKTF